MCCPGLQKLDISGVAITHTSLQLLCERLLELKVWWFVKCVCVCVCNIQSVVSCTVFPLLTPTYTPCSHVCGHEEGVVDVPHGHTDRMASCISACHTVLEQSFKPYR